MIRVKVCGMTTSANINQVAEAKPDYIGFIFYPPSPRYVGNDPEDELFHIVPESIKKVGVFINEDNKRILDLASRNGIEMIQLHGDETPESCRQLRSSGLLVTKTFNVDQDFNFESLINYMPVCDFFLFDTKSIKPGGSGEKFNWRKLEEYTMDKPFFLSGGIGHKDADLIKKMQNKGLFAVDINSRFETSPGIKDPLLVKKFIKEIKNDK